MFPDALARRRRIFAAWREVASRYGFEEYDGPPLEPVELYTKKSGDEIVAQLYRFTDKGDRDIALRPEMTPTLARMVAQRAAQHHTQVGLDEQAGAHASLSACPLRRRRIIQLRL